MFVQKLRLADWKLIEEPFPSELIIEFRKAVSSDFEWKHHAQLLEIHNLVICATKYLNLAVDYIKKKSSEKGIVVSVYGSTCHRERCMTCLAKYKNHFPYFKVKYPNGKRVTLPQEDITDFLTSIGLTPNEIEFFRIVRNTRLQLIEIYHTLFVVFNHLGLTNITLEER